MKGFKITLSTESRPSSGYLDVTVSETTVPTIDDVINTLKKVFKYDPEKFSTYYDWDYIRYAIDYPRGKGYIDLSYGYKDGKERNIGIMYLI